MDDHVNESGRRPPRDRPRRPWSVVVGIDRVGTVTLHLHGEIDVDAARSVRTYVDRIHTLPKQRRRLAVDCSDVTFMDSRGLASLLRDDARVTLINPSGPVVRLLRALGRLGAPRRHDDAA